MNLTNNNAGNDIDFVCPTEINYSLVKGKKWTPKRVLEQLRHFELWLMASPDNVSFFDYMQFLVENGIYLNLNWLWDIKNLLKGKDDDRSKEARNLYQNIRHAIARKKLDLAGKGKRNTTATIFELKARHGWRDGTEGAGKPQISVNMAINGLSEEDLARKIEHLASKGGIRDRIEAIRAKQAEFEVLSSD